VEQIKKNYDNDDEDGKDHDEDEGGRGDDPSSCPPVRGVRQNVEMRTADAKNAVDQDAVLHIIGWHRQGYWRVADGTTTSTAVWFAWSSAASSSTACQANPNKP
jgi:hypothetical protein